jgi:acyl dehydratase
MIFSIGIGLTASEINPEAFSKGYDRMRFVKPVFIGDTIHSEITISEKSDAKKPEYGTVVEHVEMINQHGEVVLVCDHLLLAKENHLNKPEDKTLFMAQYSGRINGSARIHGKGRAAKE